MKTSFKTSIYSFSAFAVSLLVYRLLKSDSMTYIFLAWNLFLAFIPYWISSYLSKKPVRILHIPLLFIWLLFLPNSPYILTDLFHLRLRAGIPLWFDLVLVSSFALIGFALLYRSLLDMIRIFKKHISEKYLLFLLPILFCVIAFGLYLGRYLRFNSWDVVQHPFRLMAESFNCLFCKDAIGFVIIFAAFMGLVYLTLTNFNPKEKSGGETH